MDVINFGYRNGKSICTYSNADLLEKASLSYLVKSAMQSNYGIRLKKHLNGIVFTRLNSILKQTLDIRGKLNIDNTSPFDVLHLTTLKRELFFDEGGNPIMPEKITPEFLQIFFGVNLLTNNDSDARNILTTDYHLAIAMIRFIELSIKEVLQSRAPSAEIINAVEKFNSVMSPLNKDIDRLEA